MIRGIEECYAEVVNVEIIAENLSGFFYFQVLYAKYIAAVVTEKKVKYAKLLARYRILYKNIKPSGTL